MPKPTITTFSPNTTIQSSQVNANNTNLRDRTDLKLTAAKNSALGAYRTNGEGDEDVTDATVNITVPTDDTWDILVLVSGEWNSEDASGNLNLKIKRGSTSIYAPGNLDAEVVNQYQSFAFTYLDAGITAGTYTYKLTMATNTNYGNVRGVTVTVIGFTT